MMRTYIDSGVLIAAARGMGDLSAAALAILGDPGRIFVSSVFVQLEVLPKPRYTNRVAEVHFYETFFAAVAAWADPALATTALALAQRYGLSALDALHVATALSLAADVLVTTERVGKPIHRVTELRIVAI